MIQSDAVPISFWQGSKPNVWHLNGAMYRIIYRDVCVLNGRELIDIPEELMIFPEFWAYSEDDKVVVMVRIS